MLIILCAAAFYLVRDGQMKGDTRQVSTAHQRSDR